MSQQKTKKTSSLWFQCENCESYCLNKDIEVHSSDCPPNLQKILYGFVKNEILYGTADVKSNEEIKNLSSRHKDNMVFLSQAAIQLCSFSIGDYVLVQPIDKNISPVAKIVWPTVEKSVTSVLFTKSYFDLTSSETGQIVTISKLQKNIKTCSCIYLIILNAPKSLEYTSELSNRISKTYSGHILTQGNCIQVMFYGKVLKFEVKSIECQEDNINLETDFSRLSVSSDNVFFLANDTTKWKLFRDQESFEKETQTNIKYNIGGLDEEMDEIREILYPSLQKNVTQSRGVLLYGNSGTGKSLVANALAKESKANTVKINPCDLYSKYLNNVEETVKEIFQNAIENAPSVIILDEFDLLCPVRTSRISDTEKRIVSTFLNLFDKLSEIKNSKVFIIATTNKVDNIDPAFRRCGRLDREIEIPTPNPKARKEILQILLHELGGNVPQNNLQEVAMQTHGYVGADLKTLCSMAVLNFTRRNGEDMSIEDFKFALRKVKPSAMREVQIEVPNVKWGDIGGQDKLKLILKQAVEWPLKYSESFTRLGITPPRGVLMFGPPGCSKTMIAKALATESGLNFLSIKGPELFSKWVGESEKAIREVFRKARQVAPSIVFFDEIDAIGGERGSGSSTSVQERVLAQLLTELDGVTPLGDITILAATNRPDKIDKALLRPGRLDRIVYVPLPDELTRKEILKIKLSKMPVKDVSLEELVKKTERYSGAEVNALCHEAAMMALEDNLEAAEVNSSHFLRALELVTPRTPDKLIQLYEDYMKVKI